MQTPETVFEQTYRHYLGQLGGVDFESIAARIGAQVAGNRLKIPLFGDEYEISPQKITDISGKKPPHDICVILSKYILLGPPAAIEAGAWVSFRDLRDSGPLIHYFANEVERAIADRFARRTPELEEAGSLLGGCRPALDLNYDFSMQFAALPKIALLLLFNDADDEFPAQCSVLFESRAEKHLDAECIAMLGWQLSHRLKKAY